MKLNKTATIICILFSLISMSGCWVKPDQSRFITDEQGRALIFHGLNTSNTSKHSPDHMPWVTEEDVEREVVSWGFNFVRFLIFWGAIEPEKGIYDEEYLADLEQRVNWYTSRGAYVMFDMHQDLYGYGVGGNGAPAWATETGQYEDVNFSVPDGTPWWVNYISPKVIAAFSNFWSYDRRPYLQDHYIAAWIKVVERFKDNPRVIGYDLMNEPYSGNPLTTMSREFERTHLKQMYDRLIPEIRAIDSKKWIFYEPQAIGVVFGVESKLPPIEDHRVGSKRLVYAPHSYPFTMHEGVTYNLTDKANMRDWNRNRVKELNAHKVPLLVGEFGGDENTPGFLDYLDDTLTMFDTMGASWAYWSNDPGGWGLVGPDNQETKKADYLVRPYPQAIAGQPIEFSFDHSSKVFELSFSQKNGVTGTTDIYVPSRHYPNGWSISCSDEDNTWGYEWDSAREVISITTNMSQGTHHIRIQPAD